MTNKGTGGCGARASPRQTHKKEARNQWLIYSKRADGTASILNPFHILNTRSAEVSIGKRNLAGFLVQSDKVAIQHFHVRE
jgi:hypothetical protein